VPEVGHFLAAGIKGLHLTKFAIGFSPTLTNYKGKKVEFTKAFPSERLPEKIKAKLICDHP
jgi:membrane-associated protease RseP (regulator of RpoE activity)